MERLEGFVDYLYYSELHLTHCTVIIDTLNKNRITITKHSPFTTWRDLSALFTNDLLSFVSYKESRTIYGFSIVLKIESSKHGIPSRRQSFYLKRIILGIKLYLCISDNLFVDIPNKIVYHISFFIINFLDLFVCCTN